MIKIEFDSPRTALEIRKPFADACRSVADELGFYARLHLNQQRALSGHPGDRKRERIGNAKHQVWFVDYQTDPPQSNRPNVIGRVTIVSATLPEILQFGGFDYGKYGDPVTPTYDEVTIDVPEVPHHYRPIIPTPEMVSLTEQEVQERFASRP